MSARDPLHFLQGVSPKVLRAMHALGVAESLTDYIACEILQRRGISEQGSKTFLELLHCADYVVPRNSEWHFTAEVRTALQQSADTDQENLRDIHELLLKVNDKESRAKAGDIIPAYLFTHAGRAFHNGALGNVKEALQQYAYAANVANSGELWLAGWLGEEQQNSGILPADAIEPAFLRAYAAFRDGDVGVALPILVRISNSSMRNELVAWSMQLVGTIETRRNHLDLALQYLNQAVQLFEELELFSKLVWALSARALTLRKAGKLQTSLDDIKRAISLCDGDWMANLLINSASTNRKLGRLGDTMADLDQAMRIATDRVVPSILVQRAALRREMGDFLGALEDLGVAVEACQYEQMSVVLNTRAGVLWDLGRTKEALHDLDNALDSASMEMKGSILNTRASIRRDDGDFGGCLADYYAISAIPLELRHNTDMVRLGQHTAEAHKIQIKLNAASMEGEIYKFWYQHFRMVVKKSQRLRTWYRAAEFADRAFKYASTDDERFSCYLDIGQAFEKAAESRLALAPLLHAVKLKPDSSLALATLAHVIDLEKHPISESEPYFARAISADASNNWAKSWYGLALSRAGRYPEAVQYAQEATRESSNAILIFNYAKVLQASPNLEERRFAIEVAKRAKEIAAPWFNAPALFLIEHPMT